MMQFALCSSTSDEVHHAIFKASKLLHGDDELLITDMPKEEVERYHLYLEDLFFSSCFAYLALMKILTLQGLAVETIELKGGLLERFTHEMEPFLRKQGMRVRLNKRCIPAKNTFATTVSNIDQDLAQEKCVPRARKVGNGDSS
ncbi:hypothetical protein DY000_02046497 [Brassica cretica]|uniref:Uncharacterized protein n=1 Tax=Brassica cretica TaxID=69181 RepID=A0ABQ7F2E9_BRACR|nr:hypothetical protein DY000_02046497 [Brassica cretica]